MAARDNIHPGQFQLFDPSRYHSDVPPQSDAVEAPVATTQYKPPYGQLKMIMSGKEFINAATNSKDRELNMAEGWREPLEDMWERKAKEVRLPALKGDHVSGSGAGVFDSMSKHGWLEGSNPLIMLHDGNQSFPGSGHHRAVAAAMISDDLLMPVLHEQWDKSRNYRND